MTCRSTHHNSQTTQRLPGRRSVRLHRHHRRPSHDEGGAAAYLINYAQMTPGAIVEGVEVREHAGHRAFNDPRQREIKAKTQNRVYGSCTTPVIVRYSQHVDHELHVRCRSCPGCLRARRYLWQMRAEAEMLMHQQTLFFTGTFADQTDDIEVVKEHCTRFLKRARKRAATRDCRFRYLLVPERHKSGKWHIHGLFHSNERLVTRDLDTTWDAGYTWTKLADLGAAGYVTKYVAKDLLDSSEHVRPRIRASRAPTYGGWVMVRDQELVKQILAEKPEEELTEVWRKNLQMIVRQVAKDKNPSLKEKLDQVLL